METQVRSRTLADEQLWSESRVPNAMWQNNSYPHKHSLGPEYRTAGHKHLHRWVGGHFSVVTVQAGIKHQMDCWMSQQMHMLG